MSRSATSVSHAWKVVSGSASKMAVTSRMVCTSPTSNIGARSGKAWFDDADGIAAGGCSLGCCRCSGAGMAAAPSCVTRCCCCCCCFDAAAAGATALANGRDDRGGCCIEHCGGRMERRLAAAPPPRRRRVGIAWRPTSATREVAGRSIVRSTRPQCSQRWLMHEAGWRGRLQGEDTAMLSRDTRA